MARFDPQSYSGLDRLGRIALSENFHMREFLYSEVAVQYQLRNVPEKARVNSAIEAGSKLCNLLLEPLQKQFGRVHVRSGYRSLEVNAAGKKHNCATDNRGFHTWDYPSENNGIGATACISVPSISKAILAGMVPYESIAWWVHDNLPAWSHLEFFATPEHSDEVCFNIGWLAQPLKMMTTWRGGAKEILHKRIPSAAERAVFSQSLVNACGSVEIIVREDKGDPQKRAAKQVDYTARLANPVAREEVGKPVA